MKCSPLNTQVWYFFIALFPFLCILFPTAAMHACLYYAIMRHINRADQTFTSATLPGSVGGGGDFDGFSMLLSLRHLIYKRKDNNGVIPIVFMS